MRGKYGTIVTMTAAIGALVLSVPVTVTPAWAQNAASQAEPSQEAQMRILMDKVKSLHPQKGTIIIPEAKSRLNLGEDYVYYDAKDARTILVDLWGNHPGAVDKVLGLVQPAKANPLSDAWGAVITYEATGYVSDGDASSTDYDALLKQLQENEERTNSERQAQGYPAMNLVGWAERPTYDATAHSVIWAQNIKVSDQTDNSLNYDVRLLGRSGVLSLNLVSTMSKLPEIKSAADEFVSHASFDAGSRYADFNKSTDKVAEYGVGGLVAAGLGMAAAKKAGLLGLILAFGKKGLFIVLALFAALFSKIKGLFSKNKEEADYYQPYDGK